MAFKRYQSQLIWCAYHDKYEKTIPKAPHCPECWHQFKSGKDLLKQHNAHAPKGAKHVTDVRKVYSCPLCAHDL